MPVVSREQMSKLKEIQASLPWIVNGITDDTYRMRGAEVREKLLPFKADIEDFFIGAKHDYITTFAILLGLDKLTFMKWAADENVTLPGAREVPRVRRGPGRPRVETKTPPERAEPIANVVEEIHALDHTTGPVTAQISYIDTTLEEELPRAVRRADGNLIRDSLTEALVPLKAQMEEISKYRDSTAREAEHYSRESEKAAEILIKYEELTKILDEYVKMVSKEDAGTDV